MRRGAFRRVSQFAKSGQPAPVVAEVGILEARHIAPNVLVRKLSGLQVGACQETPPQWREGDKGDAQLRAGMQHAHLDVAAPQRVFRLHRRQRVYGVGLPDGLRGGLRQADMPDLAFLDKAAQHAHAVFQRGRRDLVEAVQVVQVDDVRLQAPQGVLDVLPQLFRTAVDGAHAVLAAHAALAYQEHLVPVRFQERPHQLLVAAEAVQGGAVEMGDAQVQGLLQHAPAGFRRRRRPVGMGQVHAAQADGGDRDVAEIARSQGHCPAPLNCRSTSSRTR